MRPYDMICLASHVGCYQNHGTESEEKALKSAESSFERKSETDRRKMYLQMYHSTLVNNRHSHTQRKNLYKSSYSHSFIHTYIELGLTAERLSLSLDLLGITVFRFSSFFC